VLNTANLEVGVYLLSVKQGGYFGVVKVVKE